MFAGIVQNEHTISCLALIAFGVREFATVNKIFTVLNICVILFVIILGLTQANPENWALTPERIHEILA